MADPNPYAPPDTPAQPIRPVTKPSPLPFWGAVLGAFAGLVFHYVAEATPEGLFWFGHTRRGGKIPTPLGTAIAVGLTILGSILGGLYGRMLARQVAARASRNHPTP